MEYGVIFDVDGVLADSYSYHKKSWDLTAAKEGIHISDERFLGTYGRTAREVVEVFWGPGVSPERTLEIDREKEETYRKLIERAFPARKGARELVRTLREHGFHLALGSSGPKENVETAIQGLGIRDCLDAVVSGDDVLKGKPDPEIFLLAAKRLGLSPARCVVIEDSPYGIAAAHAAGMKCIGFMSTGHHRGEYDSVDRLVFDLEEIHPEEILRLLSEQTGERK